MHTLETPQQPVYIVFGGGTAGAAAEGIVEAHPYAEVYAAVGGADDGSWTGKLRTMFDTPPVGDLRRSISALAKDPEAAEIFESRFDGRARPVSVERRGNQLLSILESSPSRISSARAAEIIDNTNRLTRHVSDFNMQRIKGVSLGHLVMTALAVEHGNIDTATQEAGDLMMAKGHVIPTSLVSHGLRMKDGPLTMVGEHSIDDYAPQHPDNVAMSLFTKYTLFDGASPFDVPVNPRLEYVIGRAQKIGVGPGSVYTSMIPALLPYGTKEALADAQDNGTTIAIIGNLVNEKTETKGWPGVRYVKAVEQYLAPGRNFDEVIYNRATDLLPSETAVRFDRDLLENQEGYRVIPTDLVSKVGPKRRANDPLTNRAQAVHDMGALGTAFVSGSEVCVRELVSA